MSRMQGEPHAATRRQGQEKQILGLQRLPADPFQRTGQKQTPEDGIMPPLRPPLRTHKGKTSLLSGSAETRNAKRHFRTTEKSLYRKRNTRSRAAWSANPMPLKHKKRPVLRIFRQSGTYHRRMPL